MKITQQNIGLHFSLGILFFTISFNSSFFSQNITHTDPYLDYISWHFDFHSKEVILNNKVKHVVISTYEENEKGKKIKSSKVVKIIDYNSKGNPIKIESRMEANDNFNPSIGKFNRPKEPLSRNNRTHLITLDYDSLNRISSMIESIPIEGSTGRRVIETNNFYNEYGNLQVQIQKETTFYDKTQKNTLEYTTKINTITFIYSNRDYVKYYIYENHLNDTSKDTITVEMSIDSLLNSFTLDDYALTQTKDSTGKVVEEIHKTCVKCFEGLKCFETPTDRKIKYFYDDSENLIFEEFYQRNGSFNSRRVYHYDEKNLLRSLYFKDSKYITYFNYEFY